MQKFVARRARTNIRRQVPQKRQFESLNAVELFCPKCGRSMPVRERLLLVLPEGDKYEYLCVRCGTSVGDRIVKGEPKQIIIT
jgi:DNA-directed RNA polymerase subunit RPC12/RpoP